MFWGLYTRPANTCWKMQVLYIMIYTYNNTYIYILYISGVYLCLYVFTSTVQGPQGVSSKRGLVYTLLEVEPLMTLA